VSELAVTVAGVQRARFDATGLVIPAGTGITVPTLTASMSVVTPLVGTTTVLDFGVQTVGATRWVFSGSSPFSLLPVADNAAVVGGPANRIASVFTPIIDSGTTGPLSLKTNNGTTGFVVAHIAGVDFFQVQSNTGTAQLYSTGASTNVGTQFGSKGTGTHSFVTDIFGSVLTQFQILHTASATRSITVTGSNGGNPTISTTAGSLAITPAVVIAGLLSQGATPALTGNINLPYSSVINGRRNDNGADVGLVGFGTTNGITDTVVIGSGSGGVYGIARSGGAAPTTLDLAAGRWTVWRDTGGATTKLYYNNAGVIQSVALV